MTWGEMKALCASEGVEDRDEVVYVDATRRSQPIDVTISIAAGQVVIIDTQAHTRHAGSLRTVLITSRTDK